MLLERLARLRAQRGLTLPRATIVNAFAKVLGKQKPTKLARTPLTYGLHKSADPATRTLIYVDPNKLHESWKNDYGYLKRDPEDVRFNYWDGVAKGEGGHVESPSVYIGPEGHVGFNDGRHRFTALRDAGHSTIGVTVPKNQVEQFQQRFGFAKPAKLARADGSVASDFDNLLMAVRDRQDDIGARQALADEMVGRGIIGQHLVMADWLMNRDRARPSLFNYAGPLGVGEARLTGGRAEAYRRYSGVKVGPPGYIRYAKFPEAEHMGENAAWFVVPVLSHEHLDRLMADHPEQERADMHARFGGHLPAFHDPADEATHGRHPSRLARSVPIITFVGGPAIPGAIPAIGVWPNGAEPSNVLTVPDASAAEQAAIGNQQHSAIWFQPGPGEDALHILPASADPRADLERHGVSYATITRDRVYVVDQGGQFVGTLGGRTVRGRATFKELDGIS